jgi:GTP pyrophosphokinase
MDLFQDQVFCFTPTGELIALPSGATPVDFAYEVHSEVGDSCVGAKINGRIVPLRSELRNGDQVEIITSGPGAPSPAWETFVVTGKARSRIRRFVRSKQQAEYAQLGEAILRKTFADGGFEVPESVLEGVLERFDKDTVDDLFAAVGEGLYTGTDVMGAVVPALDADMSKGGKGRRKKKGAKGNKIAPRKAAGIGANGAAENPIPIRGLIPGMAVHYANCCHPLPGDRIVGIMTAGKGVTIHTIDCETLESFHETPERWLDVAWDLGGDEDQTHVGRLALVVANKRGSLAELSSVVAKYLGNINNLKITNRSTDFFEMSIDIEVRDSTHLNDIMAALRAVSAVNSVERAWE